MPLQHDVQQLVSLLRSAAGTEREGLLAGVQDWPRLIGKAVEWSMVLPLAEVVGSSRQMPAEHAATLAEVGTQRALMATRQTWQLNEVLGTLAQAGIPALSYKGPTLAYLAFGHLGAREFCDLDLLVHPADYGRAVKVLANLGFRHGYPPPTRCQLSQAYEVTMVHEERRLSIDLHRSFFADSSVFGLSLQRHTPYQVSLLGRSVSTLEPTELLLLLAVHGTKHCWRRLRWIHDLHGLVERQTICWPTLGAKARAEGATRAVSLGLTLASELFGTGLRPDFAPNPATRRLVEESKAYLGARRPPDLRRQHRYSWHAADTPAQRVRYLIWTLFFPHELDLAFVDLPESCYPLYFLVRPVRLLQERLLRRRRDSA